MGRRTHRRRGPRGIVRSEGGIDTTGGRPLPPPRAFCDRRWAADLRSAIGCAASFLALLVLVDEGAGTLTPGRVALWTGLALLLFLALFPPRVTAGEGWLAVRGLLRTRRVRTDRLVSARSVGSVSRRLVFRDAAGGRVELAPQILVANPPLWRRLDTDIRTAAAKGHLPEHPSALRELSERIDRETAWAVFKISGLVDEADESSDR